MPINPNIALGAQQPQPVNMLGQVGQMIALKAATEEMRGNEEMRNLFSGGVNFEDPEFQKRGYMANPKAFQELLGKRATTQKTEMEALGKEITLRRDALANVDTPEDYLKWHEANHTGRLGTFFKSAGISPSRESIMAKLSQPGGLAKLKQASALGATRLEEKLMDEAKALKVAGIGAGATMRGQDLLEKRERDKMALTAQERNVIAGEGEFLQTDKFGNVYQVPAYGALRGPNAPAQPLPPAAANAFVTQQPSVNALAPTAPSEGAGPTVANAMLMEQQQNVPRPKQPIRQPVAVMKDGRSVLVPPEKAVGMQPATAFTEKTAENKAQTERNINTAISNLTEVIKPGGLLEKSTGSGIGKLRDISYGFVGKSTEGGIAAAKLAPIADLVLKMVPRFEGPQSDKDTQSYKEAAGQLADSSLPNEIRAGAAKTILDLMKARKNEFQTTDRVSGSDNVIDFGSLK